MIIHQENGLKYLTKLPKQGISQVRFQTGVELMMLGERKKVWTSRNIVPRHGLPLLIYSPFSDRYWMRTLAADHNIAPYRRYIKDKNLYILWDDKWKGIVSEEREGEGMKYYHYNEIRELLILREHIERRGNPDTLKTNNRMIDLRIEHIKNLYS